MQCLERECYLFPTTDPLPQRMAWEDVFKEVELENTVWFTKYLYLETCL